jgi:WD40 repeat protein
MKRTYIWLGIAIIGLIGGTTFLTFGRERARLIARPDDFAIGTAFAPDGQTIAYGTLHDGAQIRRLDDGQLVRTIGQDRVTDLAFTSDSQMLITSGWGEDSKTHIWRVSDGQLLRTFDATPTPWIYSNTLSPDESVLALTVKGGVAMFRMSDGAHIRTLNNEASEVAFSPDGKFLIAGGIDGIHIYLTATGELQRAIPGWAISLTVSKDGRYIASSVDVNNTRIGVWNLATGASVAQLGQGQDGVQVHSLAFSPHGHLLVSGTNDGVVQLWDVESSVSLKELDVGDSVESIAFSPDGRSIAIGIHHALYLWVITDDTGQVQP